MANKESTAVNALIDLVQVKPLGGKASPGDDLFRAPKQPQPPAPLPRLRAPGGTSQLQLHDVPASKVRMMHAPTNGGVIPSIKQAQQPLPPPPATRPSGTPTPTLTATRQAQAVPPPRPRASAPPPRPITAPPVPRPSAPLPTAVAGKPVVRVTAQPIPKPVAQPPSRPNEGARIDAIAAGPNPFAAMPTFTPPRPLALDMTGDVVAAESWFESSRAVEKFEEETFVGTAPVVRIERRRKLVLLKIVATSVVFVVIGVVIGAYIAFHGEPDARATTIAKAAPAAPKTIVQQMPAAVAPVEVAPAPKLTDVRIDSAPSGATVMLVDNGKQSFLGSTPIATSLDPSRSYDVVFTLDGRPSKVLHFDPASAQRVDAVFDKPAPAPVAVAVAQPAPKSPPTPAPVHHVAARAAVGQIADPGFEGSSGGNGTLMVSTKPPCDIMIDGQATGLHTPQRAIPLSAGAHKVTFVNAAEHINKTVSVSVTSDHTTKLIKDLLGN
ncbi:MAG TPA: hypothetical protein VH143_00750 [Kofleriaceae bacterium]|nr:hypothetical protein [Kofleriaceae bacterium]